MEGLLGILAKVGFDWQVAFVNLVNFLIIYFLLNKFAFKPLRAVLERRQAKIQEGVAKAEESDRILRDAEEAKRLLILEAEQTAHKIITETHTKGESILKEYEEKGVRLYEEISAKARIDVDRERAQAEYEVKKNAADLVVRGVEQFLKEGLTKDQEKKIVSDFSNI